MKKVKGLTETLARLERVCSDPRLGPSHREDLRKAKRELKQILRSGKLDRRQIFRVTALITAALAEALVERAATTPMPKQIGGKDD